MRHFILFITVLCCLEGFSQEPLMPVLDKLDSVQLKTERQLMYRQLLSGVSPTGELTETWQLPDFNLKRELANRWSYDLSGFTGFHRNYGLFTGSPVFAADPFSRNSTIFSKGSYQLGENFKVGGYSFGGNSVFSAPFPNQGVNNYDFRGSTLFMQYKFSKNFKIETQVNVIQGPGP